jgi:hypothetical protein
MCTFQTRISPDKDAKQISLVMSKQGSLDVETRYSLFVYSLGSVQLDDIPERLLHSVTVRIVMMSYHISMCVSRQIHRRFMTHSLREPREGTHLIQHL